MWRFLLAVAVIVSVAEAQRSSYAPRSNSKLLPRYRNKTSSSTTEQTLDNRGGDLDEEEELNTPLPSDLQGTLEDESFVHRVSKWPEERQPFWFKNRHAISSMRGRDTDGGSSSQPSNRNLGSPEAVPRFQSPFFGASNLKSRNSQNLARFHSNDGYFFPGDLMDYRGHYH